MLTTSNWSQDWWVWYNRINLEDFHWKITMLICLLFWRFVIPWRWTTLLKTQLDCIFFSSSWGMEQKHGFNHCYTDLSPLGRDWLKYSLLESFSPSRSAQLQSEIGQFRQSNFKIFMKLGKILKSCLEDVLNIVMLFCCFFRLLYLFCCL